MPCDPAFSAEGTVHPEVIGTFLLKNVHSTAIYSSLKVETIHMTTSEYSGYHHIAMSILRSNKNGLLLNATLQENAKNKMLSKS